MSGIFVPEVAIIKNKNKYPAVFEKAITKFNQVKKPANAETAVVNALRVDDAVSSIANREEEIWTIWANLCKATRV